MNTLTIDEKWAVEYDPANNDRPVRVTRYGEPSGDCDEWNNVQVAMFYALIAARAAAPQPEVIGRADNMPLADMARAEAFRTLARCIRDPAQPRKMGLSDLEGVLAWEERRIAALDDCRLSNLARPSQAGDERVARLVKEYRPTMDAEVLHSWARDVVAALAAMDTPKGGEDE